MNTRLLMCKNCRKCCHVGDKIGGGIVPLSKQDVKNLKKSGLKFSYSKMGKLSKLNMKKDGICCFLSKTGCVLPEELRPFECRIYPVHVRKFNNGEIHFMLCLECPKWKDINQRWITQIKKLTIKELKRWSRAEMDEYWN